MSGFVSCFSTDRFSLHFDISCEDLISAVYIWHHLFPSGVCRCYFLQKGLLTAVWHTQMNVNVEFCENVFERFNSNKYEETSLRICINIDSACVERMQPLNIPVHCLHSRVKLYFDRSKRKILPLWKRMKPFRMGLFSPNEGLIWSLKWILIGILGLPTELHWGDGWLVGRWSAWAAAPSAQLLHPQCRKELLPLFFLPHAYQALQLFAVTLQYSLFFNKNKNATPPISPTVR